ncbi:N/A [soil metagenome]
MTIVDTDLFTVVLIERERLPLESLARALAGEPGLRCAAAVSGPDAEVDVDPDQVDVVLVSAHVPGLDLLATVGAVRARFTRARVVVLAGYVDDELHAAAVGAGAHAVLDTSTSLDELSSTLRSRSPLPGTELDPARPGRPRDHHGFRLATDLGITERQYQVLRVLARGSSADQVARALRIKVATARDHIKALHRTLDCTSTAEMLVVGAQLGLLPELGRPFRR